MQPVAWPEPDPQVAAAITAMYGARRTGRPLAVLVRDRLGEWLGDEEFAAAFGTRGRPGWSPSRLALVTVLQRAENLTDRLAADAVRTRLDWKYLLGLALGDPGFDHTVLAEFRARVADAGLEQVALDALLERLAAGGLVKAGGKQRTDSTHVVAAVAALNRLELAGESVRAALEALAAAHPDWLEQRVCVSDLARRYGIPMTSWRPPASAARREELAIAYARDGYALLEAVYGSAAPAWLRELPAVDVLRRVLVQNYTRTITGGKEVIKRREKEPEGDGLPPGHARIASPYDTGARCGAKREQFWLGEAAYHRDLRRPPAVQLPAGRCGTAGRGPRRRERARPRARQGLPAPGIPEPGHPRGHHRCHGHQGVVRVSAGRPRGILRLGAFPVKDLNDMRRPGGQDDHGPAARSIIARIDRAFTDLPEARPGAGPYLRRLAECGWSGGTPPQELLRHAVVDVAAELYREQADPPVDLLEFSDGAFDVLFDAAHELTILMHGLSRPTPPNSRDKNYRRGFPGRAGFDKGHAMSHAQGGREGGPNYFLQAPRVNQRLSPLGMLWRDIESYLAANPGLFCFVRLAYPRGIPADVPAEAEYGIMAEGQFRTVIFPNS